MGQKRLREPVIVLVFSNFSTHRVSFPIKKLAVLFLRKFSKTKTLIEDSGYYAILRYSA